LVLNQSHWSYEKRITHTICTACAEQMLLDCGMAAIELDGTTETLSCHNGEAAALAAAGSR
jgi:hypothetical protein